MDYLYSETSDYDPITRTVVFGPGETTATVDVPITDDEILEDIETFSATLTSDLPNVVVQADNSNADITIGDNDRESYRWHVNHAHCLSLHRCDYWLCGDNVQCG